MESLGKNIQGIHKEDKEKEVREKINEKLQKNEYGGRRSEIYLMQRDITKKAKAKEFCVKCGAPSSHLLHAAFLSVCWQEYHL